MSWPLIFLVAALVYGTRALGPLIMAGIVPSPRLVRFLDTLAICVIAAIVASALVQSGLREVCATALAAAVMVITRSPFWSMAAGVLLAAAWTAFGV
ncbi:MAG: AzlD domain-containing protein [Inquilinaceae bacterium]